MTTFWDELVDIFKGREDVVLLPDAPIVLNRIIHQLQGHALIPFLKRANGISLDIGTGLGRWMSTLAEKADFSVGLDSSRSMLEIAKQRVKRTDVDFVVATAKALPIRSNEIDFTLSCVCLQHITEASKHEEAIREIARVSKSKIVLLESMSNRNELKWSHYPTVVRPKSKYRMLLRANGAKTIGQRGVAFLPCYQLLERLREFLLVCLKSRILLYTTTSRSIRCIRKAYYTVALFSILLSIPFDSFFSGYGRYLAWETVLVAEKTTIE